MSLKAKILNSRVKKMLVDMDVNENSTFNLRVECKARINPPKNKDDNTALLIMEARIFDPDSTEIEIVCETYFIFEFEKIPNDYDSVAIDVCAPIAQTKVFDTIDKVLEGLGYPKLELANRTGTSK